MGNKKQLAENHEEGPELSPKLAGVHNSEVPRMKHMFSSTQRIRVE